MSKAARTCLIEKTFTKGSLARLAKTERSLRTITLSETALSAVEEAEAWSNGPLLFPAAMGGHINLDNWRRRVWYPALDRVGLERRPPYALRHTFATLALTPGATIEWVSRYMGHADIRTTLRHYVRFLPEIDTRNLERLDSDVARFRSGCVTSVSPSNGLLALGGAELA